MGLSDLIIDLLVNSPVTLGGKPLEIKKHIFPATLERERGCEIIESLNMNQKFGGGRQPTGTPSLAWSCVVVVVSLLAGASVVHNIYKPNLVSLSLSLSHNHFNLWHIASML